MDEQNQQQTLPPQQPTIPPQNLNPMPPPKQWIWIKWVLSLILVAIISSGATYLVLKSQTSKQPPSQVTQTTPTPLPSKASATEGDPTANWKIYTDPNLRFSVKYPLDFEIITTQRSGKTYSQLERAFNKPDSGPISFIGINVIPEGTDSDYDVEFGSSAREKLFSMRIGEEKSIDNGDDARLARFFTYERLEEVSVSGRLANVFQNKTPWGYSGTIEKVIFIQNGNTLYIINAFIGEKEDITPLLFDQILPTFEFTSQ